MTRQQTVEFARGMYPIFKTMKREEWRDHLRNEARSRGESEQWITRALAWMEAAFTFAKTNGI